MFKNEAEALIRVTYVTKLDKYKLTAVCRGGFPDRFRLVRTVSTGAWEANYAAIAEQLFADLLQGKQLRDRVLSGADQLSLDL
jgi:hypothetical protein